MPLSVVGSVNATSTPAPASVSWNLSVEPHRFWIYEAKVRDCPLTPHFQERGRCGICGVQITFAGSGFCGDECAREFVVNHNWDHARYAALHRDQHTCSRCGFHATSADPTQGLVVRHVELPQSGNVRGRGCHQHLTNLQTLCRSCDTPAQHVAPPTQPGNETDAGAAEDAAASGGAVVTMLRPPATTVRPEDLEKGRCHPSSGGDPDLWFSSVRSRIAKQQKICQTCPVKIACATYAVDMGVTDGVFAGVSLPGRRHATTLRARQKQLKEIVEAAAGHPTPQPQQPVAAQMEQAGA